MAEIHTAKSNHFKHSPNKRITHYGTREDTIVGYLLFAEYNGYGGTDTEIAFDGKLGVVDGADVLYDSKTKTGAANTLGMGFVHSISLSNTTLSCMSPSAGYVSK